MLSSWRSCCAGISQRWVFTILAFFSLWLGNALRVALSISITEMTIPIEEKTEQLEDTCEVTEKTTTKNVTIIDAEHRYDWDEYTQGLILSSYFWGYAITHFPSGLLSEQYGAKHFLGMSVFVPAILTFFTPVFIYYGESTALIVLRVMIGLAAGAMYPAVGTMLPRWTVPVERTRIGSIIYAGSMLGNVCGTLLSALIIRYSGYGWPAVFYTFGTIGMVWYLLWSLLCYNSPKQHPFISQAEFKFLKDHSERKKKPPPAPYKHIFSSKQSWAYFIALFGLDWNYFMISSDLPKYMGSVVKFPIEDNGFLSSLPYLGAWIFSILCFWIVDRVIERQQLKLVTIRKLLTVISILGPSVFILGASYAECDHQMVVVMFVLGITLIGAAYPSIFITPSDLSPNYTGSLVSIANGLAAISGIITPYIIGILTPNQTISEWRYVFWIVFAVAVLSCLYFVIYGSADVQAWDDPDFLRNEKNKKIKQGVNNVVADTGDL